MEQQKFSFIKRQKLFFVLLITLGVVALLIGIFTLNSNRIWSNLLLNTFYFLGFALAGTFFISVHIVAQAGWHVSIQRIPEAMSGFIPVAAILMAVIIVFGAHDIYHWSHEHLDKILEGKRPYLNMTFFIIRLTIYFAGWIFLAHKIRQLSVQSDFDPDLKYFKKSQLFAILFIVFFALSNSTSSWDILMSIDAHWYSTLFAWYIFSSLFVSGIAVIILLLIFLRKKGYMPHVNTEHFHDLGKYLFGFSIFWTYLWFSQFMLIWYANIPEETVYFIERLEGGYATLFYLNLIVNFLIPFLVLLPRRSPRNMTILVITAVAVIIGHWIDFYLAIMPGVVGEAVEIGFFEVGLSLGFAGLFLWIVFRSLSKAYLVPKNHPFYKESLEYHNL